MNSEQSASQVAPTVRRVEVPILTNNWGEFLDNPAPILAPFELRGWQVINQIKSGELPKGDPFRSFILKETRYGALLVVDGAVPTANENFPAMPVTTAVPLDANEVDQWRRLIGSGEEADRFRTLLNTEVIDPERGGKLVVGVTGWGESALANLPWTAAQIEGYKTSGCRGRLAYIGMSPYGLIGSVELGTSDPEMSDTAQQVREAIGSWTGNVLDSSNNRQQTSANWLSLISGVYGHSMGAWVAAQLATRLTPELEAAGNRRVHWQIDNPVVHGVAMTQDDVDSLRELLGSNAYDPRHVTLLQHGIFGGLVRAVPELMRLEAIRKMASTIDIPGAVIAYYISQTGKESPWYHKAMTWNVLHDAPFVATCNAMLYGSRPIVQNEMQLETLRELSARGQIGVAVGSRDRVLTPQPQLEFANSIGLNVGRITESVTHKITLGQAREMGAAMGRGQSND